MLFPGRKFPILVDPKQISVIFKSEKQKKKKKKKKRSSDLFRAFPTSISNFEPSLYHFPSFLLNFYPFSLFSFSYFSRYVSKNFPVRSLWGGTLPPPAPPPLTPLQVVWFSYPAAISKWNIHLCLCLDDHQRID